MISNMQFLLENPVAAKRKMLHIHCTVLGRVGQEKSSVMNVSR